jgi:hypothetical protein
MVEAARLALVGWCLEGRALVEAEAPRGVEDPLRAELEADVAEHRVDRVHEAGDEVDRSEYLGTVLIGEVVDLLAVHRAVARVVEARAWAELLGLERGGRGDDLEGRARDEEPRAGAVEERRSRRAVRRDPRDPTVVLLDEVRVEARRGGHDEDLPGAGVERDHGSAVRSQLLLRDLLCSEVDVGDHVVAPDGPAPQLVDGPVDERREVRVRRREVVVERPLEPGP